MPTPYEEQLLGLQNLPVWRGLLAPLWGSEVVSPATGIEDFSPILGAMRKVPKVELPLGRGLYAKRVAEAAKRDTPSGEPFGQGEIPTHLQDHIALWNKFGNTQHPGLAGSIRHPIERVDDMLLRAQQGMTMGDKLHNYIPEPPDPRFKRGANQSANRNWLMQLMLEALQMSSRQ